MRYLVALVVMSVVVSLVIPAAMIGYGIGKRVLISAWADRQVRKAERIMGLDPQPTTHQFAHELTDGEDEYRDRVAVAESTGMVDTTGPEYLAAVLDRTERASRRLASVPDQGKPSGWS